MNKQTHEGDGTERKMLAALLRAIAHSADSATDDGRVQITEVNSRALMRAADLIEVEPAA